MATEQGIVIRLGTDTAWVRTTKSSACEGCASRGSCTAAGDDMEVEALNFAGAKIGDRIVIRFDTGPLLKATFLLYVFPILCMLAGATAGLYLAEALSMDASACSALFGFLLFFGAVAFIRFKGNQMGRSDAYKPKITRILKPSQS